MTYTNLKIPDKIIIVEKPANSEHYGQDAINQGYVVLNDGMFATAVDWAWLKYKKENKKIIVDDEYKKYIHEYDNGEFTFMLEDAACCSSQSGKLSFWNCIITDKDGLSFEIGINSELLLDLLKSTIFINGICQSKVWLGRANGNWVGAFTEEMETFKEAKKLEAEALTLKKTTNYNIGDEVHSATATDIYLGEFYCYAKLVVIDSWRRRFEYCYVALDKPIKMYGYVRTYNCDNTNDINKASLNTKAAIEFKLTKAAKVKTGRCFPKVAETARSVIDNAALNSTNFDEAKLSGHLYYDHERYSIMNTSNSLSSDVIINNFKIMNKNLKNNAQYIYFDSVEDFNKNYPDRNIKVESFYCYNYSYLLKEDNLNEN